MPFCYSTIKAEKPKDPRYPSVIQTWGDHVRARRLDLGLMKKEVALLLDVDETTVNNWETNRRTPVVCFIPRMIEFLGYTPYTQPTSVGAQLRMVRMARGLSQKKLAKQLGVDESSIQNWEAEKGRPTQKSLQVLGRFLVTAPNKKFAV